MFSAHVDDSHLTVLDKVREQVNKMKHDPGVLIDDFVSTKDYEEAVAAICGFWRELDNQESFQLP
jgi:hypothetical protein